MNKTRKAQRLKDAREELDQVKSAITAIVSGSQSYSVGSRSLQRADLDTLYKRRDNLVDLIAALEGGSGRFRRVITVDR